MSAALVPIKIVRPHPSITSGGDFAFDDGFRSYSLSEFYQRIEIQKEKMFLPVVMVALFLADSSWCFAPGLDHSVSGRRLGVSTALRYSDRGGPHPTHEVETSDFVAWKMKSWESGVFEAELDLKQAMLTSDLAALDLLLDDELLFLNHLDQVMTKKDDLEAHRLRVVEIDSINLSSWNVEVIAVNERPNLALVTVDAHIIGSLAGFFFEDNLRFHRVWKRKATGRWQVIEGDSSLVIKD